jgi:hypothetical protein
MSEISNWGAEIPDPILQQLTSEELYAIKQFGAGGTLSLRYLQTFDDKARVLQLFYNELFGKGIVGQGTDWEELDTYFVINTKARKRLIELSLITN